MRKEDDQLTWLRGKGAKRGFELLAVRTAAQVADVRAQAMPAAQGMRKETGKLSFESVVFEGRLRVTDAVRFRQTLEDGIGSAKGYGFGLLSIAPAESEE